MVQRKLEHSIGWGSGRAYDKCFAFNFGSDIFDDEKFRNIITSLLKWIMLDLQEIEWRPSDISYGWIIRGRVKGVTPKLKRVRMGGAILK